MRLASLPHFRTKARGRGAVESSANPVTEGVRQTRAEVALNGTRQEVYPEQIVRVPRQTEVAKATEHDPVGLERSSSH